MAAPRRSTPPEPAAVIAVVGSSSYIGASLLLHLEAETRGDAPEERRLVSLDHNPLRWPVSRISAHRMGQTYGGEGITLADIPYLLRLESVDTVVYVGSNYDGADAAQHLADTAQWVDAGRAAGVRQFVYLSDYRVYGIKPGHPIPITERAATDQAGAHHRIAAAEPDGAGAAPENAAAPDTMPVAVLRAAMTVGPGGANPAAQEFLARRIRTGGKGAGNGKDQGKVKAKHNPPLQFLHEHDLARAVSATIRGRLAGIYNLAGDGTIWLRDAALAGSGWPSRPGNQSTGNPAGSEHRRPGKSGDPARFPVVISATKFKQAAAFKYQYSSERALRAYCSSVLLEPEGC